MNTKIWILIFAALLVVCLGLSFFLLQPGEAATHAEIMSEGKVLHTVDLRMDRVIHITTDKGGSNTVTIKDGKIGVTEANCPDHYCMERGFCSNGAQIVCLPNKLVIRFTGVQEVDSVAG